MKQKVIDLGFIDECSPLVLTEVVNSTIVETGMKHNAPAHHFEVTTIGGEPLSIEFLHKQGVTLERIMQRCFSKRERTMRALFDGTGYVVFMLGRIFENRAQVRMAFVHKRIVDHVKAPQVWSGEIPTLQAA